MFLQSIRIRVVQSAFLHRAQCFRDPPQTRPGWSSYGRFSLIEFYNTWLGSVVTSYLHHPQFHPGLSLLSYCMEFSDVYLGFLGVAQFPPITQTHASKWICNSPMCVWYRMIDCRASQLLLLPHVHFFRIRRDPWAGWSAYWRCKNDTSHVSEVVSLIIHLFYL